MEAEPQLLTLDEAATMLRVNRRVLRRAIAAGRLRVVRLGEGSRSDRIHPDDLRQYVESSRTGGEGQWRSERGGRSGTSMCRSAVAELEKRLA